MANAPETRAFFRDVQGVFVFLNLRDNRFFALPPSREAEFRIHINHTASKVGECIISASRSVVLVGGSESNLPGYARSSFSERSEARSLRSLFEGVEARWTMKRLVSQRDLERIRLRLQNIRSAVQMVAIAEPALRLTNRVFDTVSLAISPEDDCLALACAKVKFLLQHGVDARCVIGVRRHPFAAHAWVQHGDLVIGEDPDAVQNYLPIAAL